VRRSKGSTEVTRSSARASLVLISAWQVLFYVVWRGWPFSTIAARAWRLSCAHAVVIAGGIPTYVVAHDLLELDDTRIAAVAGCLVAAGLTFGMLFEDWLRGRVSRYAERAALLVLTLALAVLAGALGATADALPLTRVGPDEWVEHAALNALSISIILHVAIGRRWSILRPNQRSRAGTDTPGQADAQPEGRAAHVGRLRSGRPPTPLASDPCCPNPPSTAISTATWFRRLEGVETPPTGFVVKRRQSA
jgi:hypothetical protein